MPTVQVPISTPVYKNVDSVELSDQSFQLIDGFLDELGHSRGRPGLKSFASLSVATNNDVVAGLYWWDAKQKVMAVADGMPHLISFSSGTASSTNLAGNKLAADLPVSFATDGTYLFMANQDRIVYTDGTINSVLIADADAPTSVSHVAFLDGYILANERETNKFYWSDVNDSLNWTATSFASAVGGSDDILALYVNNREIFLLCKETMEVWFNDGVTPFIRKPGGFQQWGCSAAFSGVVDNSDLYWLDDRKHIVVYRNGTIQQVSTPYDKEIHEFETVSDCKGHRIELQGRTFIVFSFPSEERTLVYNKEQNNWSEWAYWDSTDMKHRRWLGNSYCFAPAWSKHLVGARNSDDIFELDNDTYDDNGDELRVLRRTGHIDYGTRKRKRAKELRLRLKRGAVGVTDPKLMLRYRDDNRDWSNEVLVDLGNLGETEIVQRVFDRGVFRTRQYEVAVSDGAAVAFGGAEADIDIMTS